MATIYSHVRHPLDWEPSDPVVIPTFLYTNFVVSVRVHCNLKGYRFDGSSSPVDHLNQFQEIVCDLSFDARDWDAVCLTLFHFSLDGYAFDWYKSLPAQYIFTWDQLVDEFICAFSTPSRDDIFESFDSPSESSTKRYDFGMDEIREILRELREEQGKVAQLVDDCGARETITSPSDVIVFQPSHELTQLVCEQKLDVQILERSPFPDLYHVEDVVNEAFGDNERVIEWVCVCPLLEVVYFSSGPSFRYEGPLLDFPPTFEWKFNKAFYRKPP